MSMNWCIRFPKDHLAKADEKGKLSFAIGYHGGKGGKGGGRKEILTWLGEEDVYRLFAMAETLMVGEKTPAEALEIAEAGIAKFRAKMAAKAARATAEAIETP